MRTTIVLLGASVLLMSLLAGCGSTQSPVKVFGGKTEMKLLAGEWFGEYISTTTGRSGTISFTLKAGSDSAFGSIIMIAPTTERHNQPLLNNEAPTITWRPVQTLSICFVVIDGNHVRGTLETYIDPTCRCPVTTLFEGILMGDVIAGTYTTTGNSSGVMTNGTWRVERQRVAPDVAGTAKELR